MQTAGLIQQTAGLIQQITVLIHADHGAYTCRFSGLDAEAGGLELFLKDCAKICIANSHKSPIMCRLSNFE